MIESQECLVKKASITEDGMCQRNCFLYITACISRTGKNASRSGPDTDQLSWCDDQPQATQHLLCQRERHMQMQTILLL
jgi:hypothetical protein